MKTFLLTLVCVFAVLAALVPAFAADGAARREAARLAALRAEEATNRLDAGGAAPARPAAALQPPPADAKHVDIVPAGTVRLQSAGDLIGKRYVLQEIDGKKVDEKLGAFIEWRTGTSMTGRLCTVFHATSSFDASVVKAEELPAATKMACSDEVTGKVEERFLAAMRLGMSFLAIGDLLELRRDDLLLRFAAEKKEEEKKETVPAEDAPAKEEKSESAPASETTAALETEEKPAPESTAENAADGPLVSEVIVLEEALAGRKFVLRKVDGEEFTTTAGNQPYIEFGEGMRVGGSACNNFTGLGELSDNILKVPHAVATRKMCIDPKISEFERDFHQMLRDGADVVIGGTTLLLTGGGRTLEFIEE